MSPWWEGPTVGKAVEEEGESVQMTQGERKDDRKAALCTPIQSDSTAGDSHGLLHSFVISFSEGALGSIRLRVRPVCAFIPI